MKSTTIEMAKKEQDLAYVSQIRATGLEAGSSSGEEKKGEEENYDLKGLIRRLANETFTNDR